MLHGMKLIGLSGGIGSGKSTVARMFRELGATVIDADAIVHELQAKGTPLLAKMVEEFGPGILNTDGALQRKALGALVFQNPQALQRLNALVHPAVIQEMGKRIQAAASADAEIVILDIPLLFEGKKKGSGSAAQMPYAATLLAYVPQAVQIERTMARDQCSRDEAKQRIAAQLDIEEKKALADFVIDNSGSLETTQTQVREIFERLKKM